MDKNSPKSDFVDEKRKLLYWITRWDEQEVNFENINADIPEMSILLQTMGFRVENFKKALDHNQKFLDVTDNNTVRIELTCPKSGMKATLIKETNTCKCPTEEDINQGQFWSVTGCAPASQNSINTSNSSLLPTVSSAKTKIVKALLFKALMIINSKEKTENEPLQPPNMTLTRHRSLDTLKNSADSFTAPKLLKRQPSWEVDPRTSPPTQTSSPVPDLCKTLSKISLNSGQQNALVTNLESIKKLVNEALNITGGSNATYVKTSMPTKRVSDIKPIDKATPKSKFIATPRKILTPKKYRAASAEQKEVLPSRMNAMLKKKAFPANGVSTGRDKPRIPTMKKSANTGSCESVLTTKVRSRILKSNLSPISSRENTAGTSGISKFKTAAKSNKYN